MGNIRIGSRIAEYRKRMGITQEELAKHLGVSKPAVSKWESEQSYPDILLLPELATFFNISIDELVGFEPQMTLEEIRKLYRRLAEAFTKKPFEEVLEECRAYLKKYYSCWQLQVQIGLLLLNHVSLAPEKGIVDEIIAELLELYQRVEKASEDVVLAKMAVHLRAVCYLSQQKPVEAIELLEKLRETAFHPESLLVKAYQMKGDSNKALEHLQGYVYVNLMNILGAAQDFFQLYSGNSQKLERIYEIYNELNKIFELEELHPALLMQMELSAAYAFAGYGNKEKALDALEHSIELMNRIGKGKIILKGNDIFDLLDQYFADIDIENAAPRNVEAIWYDLKNHIINHPTFAILRDEERFQRVIKQLENLSPNK